MVFSGLRARAPAAMTAARGLGGRIMGATAMRPSLAKLPHTLLIQGAIAGATFLTNAPPEEKMKSFGNQMLLFWLTAGMGSGFRQAVWQIGLQAAPHLPDMARSVVSGYRGSLEARTSAYVPFSHSTLPMDQAFASMQYAQQRMNTMYGTIGSEASYMAARFAR